MLTTKDYELELKIKNGQLLARMRENGLRTAADLSRESGVNQGTIGKILSLELPLYICSPVKNEIKVRPAAQKLAETLVCTPQELYPEAHWFDGLPKNTFTAMLSRSEMEMVEHMSTGDPAAFLEYMEDVESVSFEKLLESADLSDRQRSVLKMRYEDGKTLEATGKEMGVTYQRIRDIERAALRKLRDRNNIYGACGLLEKMCDVFD